MRVRNTACVGGRHAYVLHQLLRERLRALEPRRGGGRAEARDATLAERIDHARDERRLRPDNDEIAALVGGRADDRIDILGRDVDAPDPVARDAGVPGCGDDLRVLRAAEQCAHDRVLAAAAPDDEDLSRRGQSWAMKSSTGMAVRDS